jgi:hypothetical protein
LGAFIIYFVANTVGDLSPSYLKSSLYWLSTLAILQSYNCKWHWVDDRASWAALKYDKISTSYDYNCKIRSDGDWYSW